MEENSVKHILILGKHQYMVDNVQGILSKGGFEVNGYDQVEKIIEEYQATQLDMIVFTGAVNPSDFSDLIQWKNEKFPSALIFEHHGGPATVLEEVQQKFLSAQ
jgi:DNA-binding NtrC family response regulator